MQSIKKESEKCIALKSAPITRKYHHQQTMISTFSSVNEAHGNIQSSKWTFCVSHFTAGTLKHFKEKLASVAVAASVGVLSISFLQLSQFIFLLLALLSFIHLDVHDSESLLKRVCHL